MDTKSKRAHEVRALNSPTIRHDENMTVWDCCGEQREEKIPDVTLKEFLLFVGGGFAFVLFCFGVGCLIYLNNGGN